MNMLGKFVQVTLTLLVVNAVEAAEYPCPSDPGFCYFDVGNDGCFDGGTDLGPINSDLEAGTYPPVGPPAVGSIVCPPSVKKLVLQGPASWTTAAGGDVLLYGKKVISPSLASVSITSGRDVLLCSTFRTHDFSAVASRDVVLTGKLVTVQGQAGVPMVTLTASTGDLSVGPKGVIRQGDILLETPGGGNISVLDRSSVQSKNGPVRVVSGGTLSSSDLKVSAGQIDLSAQSIDASGRTKLKTNPGVINIVAVGAVEFERLTADGKGPFSEINIEGNTVAIGLPGQGGVVRSSNLKAPSELEIDASGHVGLDELNVRVGRALIDTVGTTVDVTNSAFELAKKPGAAPPEVQITAGAGSTCVVAGSTFVEMTLVANCDTVIGP